jgi:hypothetical protein
MDYETLELQETAPIISPDANNEEGPCNTVSSSYEYVEGSENSPYIITSQLD